MRLFLTFLRVFALLYLLFIRLLFNFRCVLTRLCFLFLDLDIFRRLILDLLPDLLPLPPWGLLLISSPPSSPPSPPSPGSATALMPVAVALVPGGAAVALVPAGAAEAPARSLASAAAAAARARYYANSS